MVSESIHHIIGGRQVRSALLKSFAAVDPATGKEYGQIAIGLAADINQAVLAARGALEDGPWRDLSAPDRAAVLNDIAAAIEARAGEIADTDAHGTGLPVTQAKEQAAQAAGQFRLAASQLTAPSAPPAGPDALVTSPAGVVGLIIPWNNPFRTQARALAPALAAGCTVVLKPDEWAPMPAMLLSEITAAAGLPDGVLNIVHGARHPRAPGTQARDALIAHPAVTRIWFAGDPDAGRQVMTDAATHRKRLHAELTGTSPCLVLADADPDQAAEAVLAGAFALNGQRATAPAAILAERPGYDAFVSRLAKRAGQLRVGAPADPSTQVGPLVHAEHHTKVTSAIRAAVREGARMAAGGRRPSGLAEGNYLEPTVLSGVDPSMPIFADHLCGPLVRVTPFEGDEEAVSLASLIKDPQAAYIWTADLSRARGLSAAIESARVWVNSHNPQDLPAAGNASIDFYTKYQTVHIATDDAPAPRF